MEKRVNFGSKLGIILASAGSAVGLGNVWRYPTEVGANGGAVFILIYILCVVLLGVPLMVAEFAIGRNTHANMADAFRKLAPRSGWVIQGYVGVFTASIILSYYAVVAGWTLKYLVDAMMVSATTVTDTGTYFNSFKSDFLSPVLYMAAVMLMCHYVISRGVQKGIERYSKLMMPMLFIIILMLVAFSLTMPGAESGLQFLFKPDFSKIDSDVMLSAIGQAFFSLSIGMGSLCTYASYFRDDANLVKTAGSVVCIDTLVAILSGLIIFPAVFSTPSVTPDEGSGLVFITLPHVFSQAFSGLPWLGWFFSVMFYLLLLLAALTSMMALHEPVTAFLLERFNLHRHTATVIVTVLCSTVAVFCSLSLGVMSDFTPFFGMGFFEFFDFLSAKVLLPLGGIIISLFVGWRLDRKLVYDEVTNKGTIRLPFFGLMIFILRWFAPLAITAIFVNELMS